MNFQLLFFSLNWTLLPRISHMKCKDNIYSYLKSTSYDGTSVKNFKCFFSYAILGISPTFKISRSNRIHIVDSEPHCRSESKFKWLKTKGRFLIFWKVATSLVKPNKKDYLVCLDRLNILLLKHVEISKKGLKKSNQSFSFNFQFFERGRKSLNES